MSLKEKEKYSLMIVFAIDNNYYLIKNKKLKELLMVIKKKYQRYIMNNNVMFMNNYKIMRFIIDEIRLINKHKEESGLKNIINVMEDIIIDKNGDNFYDDIMLDLFNLNSFFNYLK